MYLYLSISIFFNQVSVKINVSTPTDVYSCRDKDQVNLLRQQLVESTKVSENLKKELTVYEKLYKLSLEGRDVEVHKEGNFKFFWFASI